ncbi:hypothetical protein C0075_18525 [Rhizobium sp. KAs_5_22]|uniref:YcxB family protein n=1 Tax=Ciceribacter selenitireducens TaxID=448181 RepID=UPI00048A686F|nr:YcxB family protein [Ciceribacter selenitireducens]PPJ47537.1 hypothetical protein C0075_18525 [Rhizobium sp. KAs_5_22]
MTGERSTTLTITAEDLSQALKLNALYQSKRPLNLFVTATTAGCLLLVLGFLGFYGTSALGNILLIILIPAVLILGPVAGILVLPPSLARFIYKRQKTLQQPVTYEWSEDGLTALGATGHWTIAWRDYHRFLSNDRILLFYQGPNIFQMLPTRALSNEQLNGIKRCAERISREA